ncbi:MAG TPA: LLM class F420-dependent oxidoreductase, partial [Candidatus Binataceae bacterium]
GEFSVPATSEWLDPFITLTFAAAVTKTIRLATGICLVPEHNPLILAKEIASLDRLCGGRFALGVGIGWSAEEFVALGIPFERRAQRTREYIGVMRKLWSEDITTHRGEFVNFESARAFPKPDQGAKLPVLFGGESGPALRRAAEYGDGWYGFNLDPSEAKAKIEKLRALLREHHRNPEEIEIIVAPYTKQGSAHDLARYRDAGVDEVVILANPPADESRVGDWIEQLAIEWIVPANQLK